MSITSVGEKSECSDKASSKPPLLLIQCPIINSELKQADVVNAWAQANDWTKLCFGELWKTVV